MKVHKAEKRFFLLGMTFEQQQIFSLLGRLLLNNLCAIKKIEIDSAHKKTGHLNEILIKIKSTESFEVRAH